MLAGRQAAARRAPGCCSSTAPGPPRRSSARWASGWTARPCATSTRPEQLAHQRHRARCRCAPPTRSRSTTTPTSGATGGFLLIDPPTGNTLAAGLVGCPAAAAPPAVAAVTRGPATRATGRRAGRGRARQPRPAVGGHGGRARRRGAPAAPELDVRRSFLDLSAPRLAGRARRPWPRTGTGAPWSCRCCSARPSTRGSTCRARSHGPPGGTRPRHHDSRRPRRRSTRRRARAADDRPRQTAALRPPRGAVAGPLRRPRPRRRARRDRLVARAGQRRGADGRPAGPAFGWSGGVAAFAATTVGPTVAEPSPPARRRSAPGRRGAVDPRAGAAPDRIDARRRPRRRSGRPRRRRSSPLRPGAVRPRSLDRLRAPRVRLTWPGSSSG